MIYRIAGSHVTLILVTIGIMIISGGVAKEQFVLLIDHYQSNFIPDEIALEENIAILIACFGVFLEHRRHLLKKIHPSGLPESVNRFDHVSHDIGIMFIMIGLFIEFLDLLFLTTNGWGVSGPGFKFAEILILFIANALAFAMLGFFGVRSLRLRSENCGPFNSLKARDSSDDNPRKRVADRV